MATSSNILSRTLYWLAILAALWLFLRWFEWRNIYFPTRAFAYTPDQVGLKFEDVAFASSDGVKLHGWFVPAENARLTVLFCHGNGGNISHRMDKLTILNNLGVSVFVFDYRGYGRSQGWPGERGTYLDAQAAYDWLHNQKHVPAEAVVIYGESLGSAVAVDLATQRPAGGLVLESPFTSVRDMARAIYPWLPLHLACRIRYDSLSKIPSLKQPLLLLHSREDEIVPFHLGQRLFEAAREPKKLVEMHGDHNGGFAFSEDIYREALREYFSGVGLR